MLYVHMERMEKSLRHSHLKTNKVGGKKKKCFQIFLRKFFTLACYHRDKEGLLYLQIKNKWPINCLLSYLLFCYPNFIITIITNDERKAQRHEWAFDFFVQTKSTVSLYNNFLLVYRRCYIKINFVGCL